jgi:hypothetical protein
MAAFRFIHSADLHLGRRFGTLPEAARGRLIEARHQIIHRLADAARDHDAGHILVAGDIFDTETPTDPVWRQALSAMGADPKLQWWLIPGNHDSLAAESLWTRFVAHAPANVHLIDTNAAIEVETGVFLLPAPLPRRHPGRDLTALMPDIVTEPGTLRIGLAHGAIRDFSEEGSGSEGIVPPDRAATARLDYLALGDWHGQMQIGDRTWYAGTPERDAFHHAGAGVCLAVTLTAPGAAPSVAVVPTGRFVWLDAAVHLLPDQSARDALLAVLPPDAVARRDHLIRVRVGGRARLAEQAALHALAEQVSPEFCHFVLETADLATEFDSADLDDIDRGGALRLAADTLSQRAQDPRQDDMTRRVAAAALNRLYGYLQGDRA